MSKRLLSAAVVAAVALTLPAGAARRPDPAVPASLRLAERTEAPLRFVVGPDGKPRTSVSKDALSRALRAIEVRDGRIDLRTLATLSRAAVRTFSGLSVVAPHDGGDGTSHLAVATGDLDGDGSADVLDYVSDGDGTTLVARSGRTGVALWERPLDAVDGYSVAMGDATGDGADDLVSVELFLDGGDAAGECAPVAACLVGVGATFHWVVSVLSGPTGEPVWSHTKPGVVLAVVSDSFGESHFAVTGAVAATNAIVAAFPAADHDGDGTRDLVVNDVDLVEALSASGAFTDLGGSNSVAYAAATTTRAAVLAGPSGLSMYARTGAAPGVTYLVPGIDGSGDGTTDLIWNEEIALAPALTCSWVNEPYTEACDAPGTAQHSLEMIDGRAFTPMWRANLAGWGWLYDAGGDVDADGAPDLLFVLPGEDGLDTILIGGASGEQGWRVGDVALGPVGSLDGMPVVVSGGFVHSDDAIEYEIRRRDGRTGELLSSRRHRAEVSVEGWELWILGEVWLIPDADGDGLADVFSQVTIYGTTVAGYMAVERGYDGLDLVTRTVNREQVAFPAGDLDGDGLSDLLDVSQTIHRVARSLNFSGVTLPGATTIWSAPRRIYGTSSVWFALSGDLTGAGGTDLLVSSEQTTPEGTHESAIEAIDGRNGSEAWRVGGTLTEAPEPPTGGISGRVTGDGAPFFGACLAVYDADGNEAAFEFARGDGTFTVAELADGDYRILFMDCFTGSFVAEFYDDAADYDSATPVTVAGGVVTTGIEADLAAA